MAGYFAGSIYAELRLNSKDFIQGANKAMAWSNKLANSFMTLGAIAVGIGATMVGVVAGLAMIGARAEDIRNLVTVAFGEMGDEMRKWSHDVADAMGADPFQVMESVAVFKMMNEAMGWSSETAGKMSKVLTVLAADMRSLYPAITTNAQAMRMLQSALSGQPRALDRIGIKLTEENLQRIALTKGIIDQTRELNSLEKSAAVFAYLMENTSSVQGDLQRTWKQVNNEVERSKGLFKEIAVAFGDPLQEPVALMLLKFNAALTALRDWIRINPEFVKGITDGMIKVMKFSFSMAVGAAAVWLVIKAVQILIIRLGILGIAILVNILTPWGAVYAAIGSVIAVLYAFRAVHKKAMRDSEKELNSFGKVNHDIAEGSAKNWWKVGEAVNQAMGLFWEFNHAQKVMLKEVALALAKSAEVTAFKPPIPVYDLGTGKVIRYDLPPEAQRAADKVKKLEAELAALIETPVPKPDAWKKWEEFYDKVGEETRGAMKPLREIINATLEQMKIDLKDFTGWSADAIIKAFFPNYKEMVASFEELWKAFDATAVSPAMPDPKALFRDIEAEAKRRREADMKAAGDWMKGWAVSTATAMQTSFKTLFVDAFHGDLNKAEDYFRAFGDALIDIFADMLAEITANSIRAAMNMKALETIEGAPTWLSIALSIGKMFSATPTLPAGAPAAPLPTATGFAEGTDYVPRTGVYGLHRGEAVIPARENTEREDKQPIEMYNIVTHEAIAQSMASRVGKNAIINVIRADAAARGPIRQEVVLGR